MATLYVRGVPDHLYKRLSRLANAQNRSLTAQVIALIEAALAEDEARRKQSAALDALIRGAWTPPPDVPDVVTMLRGIRGSPDDSARE